MLTRGYQYPHTQTMTTTTTRRLIQDLFWSLILGGVLAALLVAMFGIVG